MTIKCITPIEPETKPEIIDVLRYMLQLAYEENMSNLYIEYDIDGYAELPIEI